MKFKWLLVGLLLIGFGVSKASAQTFGLGLEAGANFSNFIGSDTSQFPNPTTDRLGFVGGGFLSLNFGNVFAIRPEVLYEQKGTAFSGTSTSIEADYIEVPVLLKLSLGLPVINPSILLGPSFDWNTLVKGDGANSSDINTSDIGLVGGLELDIDKFLISGRYELGLDDVSKNENIQSGTITLLVGYSFM